MPYIKDFSTLRGQGSFEVEVPRWRKLEIEYGFDYISTVLYFYWRVKGTTHTFKCSYNELMMLGNDDYSTHIKEFLKGFRMEYLEWAAEGFPEEWMREYHEEYKHFIQL